MDIQEMIEDAGKQEPIAWAVVTKKGCLQKLFYSPPTEDDLWYWDKCSGWDKEAPHKSVVLYAAPVMTKGEE